MYRIAFKTYNYLAQTSPDEYLSMATLPNILKQLRHVVSSGFITSEGLYLHIAGFKNIIIFIAGSFLSLACFRWISSDKIRVIAISTVLLICFFIYSTARFQFTVLSLNIALVVMLFNLLIKKNNTYNHQLLVFLSLLTLLPFVFLIVFSFQDGNTFRIIPRYIGYSYAFGIVLTAILFKQILRLQSTIKYLLLLVGGIQLILLGGIISDIWQDNPPRYFMTFAQPRGENPYKLAADKIQHLYAKGDTVIYCSLLDGTPGSKDMPAYSVVDAQLTNFYLPKDSQIIQRVNAKERNQIMLKKPDGQEILIVDLNGKRY